MASKNDHSELHDSTDWLATPLPSLASVDAALRCQVCKDLYTTPMITSCSHTFCSLCIRRSLTHDGTCPACRASDQEMKLRQNWVVGELVEAFKRARPEIYDFATRPVTRIDSPKRKIEEVDGATSPPQKRTRSGRVVQSGADVVVLDCSDGDGDYAPGGEEPMDGLAECPICSARMTVEAVQMHIDNCDGIPPSKKRINNDSKKPVTRPERLPHLHYSGLKDIAMRKKLADQGLLTSGSRQLMERRYTEWVTLWNANCDSKIPQGKADLKRELDVWERTQGGKANTAGREQVMGAQIKNKCFDGKAWARNNDDAFKELIAKARRKPAVKIAVPEPNTTEGNGADGDIHIPLQIQPDLSVTNRKATEAKGAREAEKITEAKPEAQLQNDKQDTQPHEAQTLASPWLYQSTPPFDKDKISSSDIGTIKPS